MTRFYGIKGEYIRWGVGVAAAALVAYFTTIATIEAGLAQVQERELNHFEEVLRRLDLLQADVRELRTR